MKTNLKLATLIVAGAMTLGACGDGYKTLDNGLQYKFEVKNNKGQQVQEGDILVGEVTMKMDTITLFSNVGNPDRFMQATPNFPGGLCEGLKLMHVGEKATFVMLADSMAAHLEANQMHPAYKPGTGMKITFEINLEDIVTKDELAEEQANYMTEMQKAELEENDKITKFIADNKITVKPNADGLYIIVKKKGHGPKVAVGKTVAMNYTGRLLDGTMFDSSVESDAKTGYIYHAEAKYEPLTYIVGKMGLIKGWEDGVMGQPAGTILQLVFPSALGYGPRGAGNMIPPYSPLTFDIEIVSVK